MNSLSGSALDQSGPIRAVGQPTRPPLELHNGRRVWWTLGRQPPCPTPRSSSFPGWKAQALARILHRRDPRAFPGLAALPTLRPLGANPCNGARLCLCQNPGYQKHWLTLTVACTVSCLGVTLDKSPCASVGSNSCSATYWMHNPEQVTLLPSPSVFSSVNGNNNSHTSFIRLL